MRAISLVSCLELEFQGNVVKNAVQLGDLDNDGENELVVGNDQGQVVIYKGIEKQTLKDLGFVSCIAIGDIFNENRNCLVIIAADGWCSIFSQTKEKQQKSDSEGTEEVDGAFFSTAKKILNPKDDNSKSNTDKRNDGIVKLVHSQRIPANAKDILLADVDGDGLNEMVLGLTDRVVRSYRWQHSENAQGRLVGLNKWECANQIGGITLHREADGSPALLIAQPGGTFMRIRCLPESKLPLQTEPTNTDSSNESLPGSSVDYQFLGLSRMRNQNISTEIVGDLKVKDGSPHPYSLATLDGTIILVREEVILWAMAVDHQVFALNKLDLTGDGRDEIIACAWDGQTYILDQDRNVVRFQLDEAVQAFTSGFYTLEEGDVPVKCFIYVTFRNKVLLYYDVDLLDMTLKKFEPDLGSLKNVVGDEGGNKELVEFLLYSGCG